MTAPTKAATIYTASLEFNLRSAGFGLSCRECADYLLRSRARILPKLIDKALAEKREGNEVVSEFVRAIHERHEAGKPLLS